MSAKSTPSFSLTTEQLRQLVLDGYTVIRGGASREQVDAALFSINQELGAGCSSEEAAEAARGSWCKRSAASRAVTDLFNQSRAFSAAQQLLGRTCPLFQPVRASWWRGTQPGVLIFSHEYTRTRCASLQMGQVALRFPGTLTVAGQPRTPLPWWQSAWHIGIDAERAGVHAAQNSCSPHPSDPSGV